MMPIRRDQINIAAGNAWTELLDLSHLPLYSQRHSEEGKGRSVSLRHEININSNIAIHFVVAVSY
jgi:hypothetical protein